MSKISLFPGDNRESLKRLIEDGVRVHSVVTDPPYGLVSIEKRFGKKDAAPARSDNNDGSFARLSRGFMGATWDGSGIERDPEFWRLIHDILLPGGFCFAFSSSTTGHRQACAMEDAGFILHPMHIWAYGQGMPKGKEVSKFLLKADADQALIDEWEGWKFGVQSQKPAIEPVYLAQRPIGEKTYIKNIIKYRVGAVNIRGCLVALTEGETGSRPSEEGRHPANLIHDGSQEIIDLFAKNDQKYNQDVHFDQGVLTKQPQIAYEDTAARYFNAFPTDDCPAVVYHQKAGKSDRGGSEHPTVKPVGLIRHLIRHITPPGGVVLDPFAGSGTTAVAAELEGFDCIIMEAEPNHINFINQRFQTFNLKPAGHPSDHGDSNLSDLFEFSAATPI